MKMSGDVFRRDSIGCVFFYECKPFLDKKPGGRNAAGGVVFDNSKRGYENRSGFSASVIHDAIQLTCSRDCQFNMVRVDT